MTYDLIIIAASTSKELIRMTQQTIDSCRAEGDVRVILVETSPNVTVYDGVSKFVHYTEEFNYNGALNAGLKHRQGDVQILANNDLLFRKGWSEIGDLMRLNGYLSACALSNDFRQECFKRGDFAYEGYTIGFQMAGWCIFVDSKVWDVIGELDTSHRFWFSDNVYVDQLKAAGISHALICSVTVDHLGSKTLSTINGRAQLLYTRDELRKYNAKRKGAEQTIAKNLQT